MTASKNLVPIIPYPPSVLEEIGHCVRHEDPDLWFSDENRDRKEADVLEALRICGGCPAKAACLEYALSVNPTNDWGIYGGTTANQRARLRNRKSRRAAA